MEINSIKVWGGVNKNGTLVLFTSEPKRNEITGKWEGDIYLNSVVYKMVQELFNKAKMSWQREAEYIEFTNKR